MGSARRVQRVNGNTLLLINDDGSRDFAYPTGNALWYVKGEDILVTPYAPTVSANTISIPYVPGVHYTINGNHVGGTIPIPENGSLTVVATPDSGYTFPAGTWQWAFDWQTTTGGFKFPYIRSGINFASYYGHSGIDWPYGTGTPIPCAGPGTVSAISPYSWAGNSVIVNHGNINGINITTLYAHMNTAPVVTLGQTVSGGNILGTIGATGQVTGAHLHFEVIYNGDRLETATPGNNIPGLGFQRTLAWMDANTDGSNW